MNKCMMVAVLGFMAGVYVGYTKEDELEDICRQSQRTKKRAIRKMHKAYDTVCERMDMD